MRRVCKRALWKRVCISVRIRTSTLVCGWRYWTNCDMWKSHSKYCNVRQARRNHRMLGPLIDTSRGAAAAAPTAALRQISYKCIFMMGALTCQVSQLYPGCALRQPWGHRGTDALSVIWTARESKRERSTTQRSTGFNSNAPVNKETVWKIDAHTFLYIPIYTVHILKK